jgi:hypothetical protein
VNTNSIRQLIKPQAAGTFATHPVSLAPHDNKSETPTLITGLPPQGGKDAILTIVDHGCSRTAIFLPCNTTITGPEITQLYLENVFQWFGLPQKIISDCNPQFTSHFGKSIAEKLHIKQNLSTMAHPQTNGLTERKNQWVKQILRILMTILPEAWPKWLPLTTAIHNNWQNAMTTLSPNQILIGYDIPINPENVPITNNDIIENRAKVIELYWDTATHLINQTAGTAPVAPSAYQIRSEVWLDATNLVTAGSTRRCCADCVLPKDDYCCCCTSAQALLAPCSCSHTYCSQCSDPYC